MTIVTRKVEDIIIVQQTGDEEFIGVITPRILTIKIKRLSALLTLLIKRGLLDKKVLQGILSEVEE